MVPTRAAGGLHTLRHIEAGLQSQLSDHFDDLSHHLEVSARKCEDSAFARAEALLAPPLATLKDRLDGELPIIQRAIQAAAAESCHESQALRTELGTEVTQLRSELKNVGAKLHELGEQVRSNATAISHVEGVHRDLWSVSESVQANVREAVDAVNTKIAGVREQAMEAVESQWCSLFQNKIGAIEAALQEVDTRARHDSSAAMDTANMLQDLLQCRIEELRLQASQDSQTHAAKMAAGLREEVVQGEILGRLQQYHHESSVTLNARVTAFQTKMSEMINASTTASISAAERNSEARVSALAAQIMEAMEGIRREVAYHGRSLSEAVEEWRQQLQDTRTSFDAADALARSSLKKLRGHMARLTDDAAELREKLGQTCKAARGDVSAVRAELQERVLQWRAFEEVGLPALLAHVEQCAGESEDRSVHAALDYSERLQRLQVPAFGPQFGATSRAGSGSRSESERQGPRAAFASGHPKSLDTGTGNAVVPSPLPPLTPVSAPKPKAR